MSTQLGRFGRRYLDPSTAVTRAQVGAEQMRRVSVGPPYGGYCPDLVPPVAQLSDARATNAMLLDGGVLSNDDGYERIDPTRLPLGDDTPPAATGVAVTGMFMSYDVSTASGAVPVRLAMTAQDGSLSRLYELSSSTGQWTHRAAENAARDMDAATTAADLFDCAFFPPATTGGNIVGACIFTNNKDQIMRYPSSATATTYDIFDQSGGAYKAKSVEVWEDRVLALNVEVSSVRYFSRLIWTNKGASASFVTTSEAAGFADFLDIKGQGLAVKRLGVATCALYFDSGVVLIQRTGIDNDPFRKLSTSYDRGLLSTHAVVNLGSGYHFGLFTDGWFYLNDVGQWEEVGLRTVGDQRHHKWHKTFYELLDWENRDRVVCTYDPTNRVVRIAFPSKGSTAPDTVWSYDLGTDTVWTDDYGTNAPNIWGGWYDIGATGTTIDALPGMIDDLPGTINDYGQTNSRFRVLHGTTNGLVFRHTPDTTTHDDVEPTCQYLSHLAAVGDGYTQGTAKRLVVGYVRPAASNPSAITATMYGDSGQERSGALPQTGSSVPGTPRTDWVSGQVSGVHLGWGVAAAAPVTITSTELLVTKLGRTLADE